MIVVGDVVRAAAALATPAEWTDPAPAHAAGAARGDPTAAVALSSGAPDLRGGASHRSRLPWRSS